MDSKEIFVHRLKIILENRKMTQRELGQLLGVTEQCISNYMQKIRIPNAKLLIDISKILNVSVDYLLGLKNNSEV